MAPKKNAYYKTIGGVKYDKDLLEKAQKAAADSPVSLAEAKDIWKEAMDGGQVTRCETKTLEYAMKELKFEEDASEFIKTSLLEASKDEGDKGISQYKQIDGVRYERNLLAFADEAMKSGGTISLSEAKELWDLAMDGRGVTPTERRTLEYIMKEKKFTAPSSKYLKGELEKVGDVSQTMMSFSKPDEEDDKKLASDDEKAASDEEKAAPDAEKEDKKEVEEAKPAEKADSDDDSGEDLDGEEVKPAEDKAADKTVEAAPVVKTGEPAKVVKEEEKKEEEVVQAKEEDMPDPDRKRKKLEADTKRRRAEKRKKQKDKKKEANKGKDKVVAVAQKGKGKAKGTKVVEPPKAKDKKEDFDDDIEIEYVVPEVLGDMDDDDAFQAVKDRFKAQEAEVEEKQDTDSEDEKPKKRQKPKTSLLDEAEDSDEDDDIVQRSKKQRKFMDRMSVAELKTLVKRPDVVEVWDTTSIDPKLLVYLKAYRNTCTVPKHWCSKRRYMAGKRGVEKPPFKLPEYIEATGISKIRQAVMDKISQQSSKAKNRDKVHPKMGKLDIDYQVLHDAFFKYIKKPLMTKHNDMYYEGKEYEAKMMTKRPGQLSAAMKEALGMAEGAPPPWLINMQRYGPPPAYPGLKIPGLNAPIPQGAEYGYHPGGWGKPPVDEFGNPLYGDWRQDQAPTPAAPEDTIMWGEVEDFDDDESDNDDAGGGDAKDGMATPMLGGTQTPLIGSGSATPVMSRDGTRSISGVSSITSGMDTPSGTGASRSKRGGIASVSGISSASLTPTPQLFQVLEEQKARSGKGMFPSSQSYKVQGRGSASAMGGIGSSGTGTPIAGIGTPIGGIGTPHGISTPHGIGTPGMGTPGIGTRTPMGIGTPVGMDTPYGGRGTHTPGIGTPLGGIGTPHVGGIATPVGGIATPVGGIATPVGGIATPVGGIATPVGGIATPVGGIATPVGGVATPTGLPAHMAPTPLGGADTPGPVTMSLNPQDVETEGILTADIIRQQLKQHEEAAAKAKLAAGQKEVAPRQAVTKERKKKDKNKFKF